MNPEKSELPPFGLKNTLLLFCSTGFIFYIETHYIIPFLTQSTGVESIIFWFLVASFGMFIPILCYAAWLLKEEGIPFERNAICKRLRFRGLNRTDILWCIGGTIAIGALSYGIMEALTHFTGGFDHSPPFMSFEPLQGNRLWILALWFPYWILNIMGEDVVWRGVILPRQEASFGRWAWLIHGLGWGLFHICFGWHLMITLLPILFILPYIVQKRRNSWIGVILHAALNGPSFIAIALG